VGDNAKEVDIDGLRFEGSRALTEAINNLFGFYMSQSFQGYIVDHGFAENGRIRNVFRKEQI